MLNNDGYITSNTGELPQTDPTFEKKIRVIGLSKTVRFLGIFDIIFSIYYTFTVLWPCLFLAFLSWCGYYGAKKFKPPYIVAYIVSLIIYTIIKFVILVYSESVLYGIFNSISVVMEIYLLYAVYKFYNDLNSLPDDSLEELRNGLEPRTISFIYW